MRSTVSDQMMSANENASPTGRGGRRRAAFIDHRPRSASAVARTPCLLVPIDEKQFQFMVQQTPFFALQVMRVLTERLRRQT